MTLTFLGTSAGKPTCQRNVSALALTFEQESSWYLFDCGEGTQRQIMQSALSLGKLETIFISHLHGDHYYGLPGLLATRKLDGIEKPLRIYAPAGISRFLASAMDISEAHLGFSLEIIEYHGDECFDFERFTVTLLPLLHSKPSTAFYVKEHDTTNRLDEAKLRAIGLKPSPLYAKIKKGKTVTVKGRVLDPKAYMLEPVIGRTLIIAGDNSEPGILDAYLDGLDLLVHEATYTQKDYDKLVNKVLHTTAKALGEAAQKHGVKNLIANHIDPRYKQHAAVDVEQIYTEIQQYYSGRLFVAEDFDVYRLGRDRVLERVERATPYAYPHLPGTEDPDE